MQYLQNCYLASQRFISDVYFKSFIVIRNDSDEP